MRTAHQSPPVRTDPELRQVIADAAAGLGLRDHLMPSGAGHDAQIVAGIAPVGMIFVPSRGGVSHAPPEDTSDAALVRGADVLLGAALRLTATAIDADQDQGELSAMARNGTP